MDNTPTHIVLKHHFDPSPAEAPGAGSHPSPPGAEGEHGLAKGRAPAAVELDRVEPGVIVTKAEIEKKDTIRIALDV